MGQTVQKPRQEKSQEKRFLQEAEQLVSQLQIFNSQAQKKQQRILFARILIYGHGHLLTHLRSFPNHKKKFLEYLLSTDYQTMDLLYQNIVCKKLMNSKNQRQYSQFMHFDRMPKRISKQFQLFEERGASLLEDGKVGLLIFAGGSSSRFLDHKGNSLPKELYTEKSDQSCLLEIILKRVSLFCQKYQQLKVFIVSNQQNQPQLLSLLAKKFKHLKVYHLNQMLRPIVNLSGKLCLQYQKGYEMLQAPSGCGDFVSLTYKGKKFLDFLKSEQIAYLKCIGIENILEKVIDEPYLGKFVESGQGAIYKCTYPQNQNENLSRIVLDAKSRKITIDGIFSFIQELQNLQRTSKQTNKLVVRRSPVWMNSVIFNIEKLIQSLEDAKNKSEDNNQFINLTLKKLQKSYWNPVEKTISENEYCFVFERELSDILINSSMKISGLMVDREEEFMPVISLEQENRWKQAYRWYEQMERKKSSVNERGYTRQKETIKTQNVLDSQRF